MNLKILKDLKSSEFRKNLLIMIGGSSVAQFIPVLLSFFLTRIYSPVEFGILTNFLTIMGFLVVFMLMKFDMAIVLPKKDSVAANLIVMCLGIGFLFFIIFTILFYFLEVHIYNLFNIDQKQNFLLYVPLGALLFSLFMLINEWFVRRKYFKTLILNKITNNSLVTFFSASLPFLGVKSLGLVKGQLIGQFLAVVSGIYLIVKKDWKSFQSLDIRIIKSLFFKYINFAKFNIPGQFINTLAGQLVIFYLTSQFGLKVVGLYALTDRIMGIPLSYIGNSVRDVFKQKATIDFQRNGDCKNIYKKTTLFLVAVSIIPFLVLAIFAPDIFSFFFGKDWRVSGDYARILFLAYLLSFITMPTGCVFVITEKQKLDLTWQIIFLASTAIAIFTSYYFFKGDVIVAMVMLAISRCFAYLVQMLMTYKLASGR